MYDNIKRKDVEMCRRLCLRDVESRAAQGPVMLKGEDHIVSQSAMFQH